MFFKNNNMNYNKLLLAPQSVSKLTAVLYSVSQDCFHLEEVQDYININVRNALSKVNKNDYRLIGIFENDIKGDEYIERFRKYLDHVQFPKADNVS